MLSAAAKNKLPDLVPLQILPKVKALLLQGDLRSLDHLAGLTGLEYIGGRVLGGQNCKFAPILQLLVVVDGTLQGPRTQELPVCTALTELI